MGRLVALVALAGAALLLAGCGGSSGYSEGRGDRANGKALFVSSCGSCHTLADAGTTGQIGPDLDAAFYESRRNGLGESVVVQVVRGQIAYPTTTPGTGVPGMPADIVTGQDAEDVTAYVASVAGLTKPGTGGGGDGTAPPPSGGGAGGGDEGASIFASAGCATCHTLAAANATGTVGPNLDDAKPDEALVVDRVTNGQGGMPSFEGQLTDAQIAAVAGYVSSNAGGSP